MLELKLSDPHPEYPPACVANGLVGLRVGRIPLLGGTALVSGYVGAHVEERMESLEAAPYPVGADVMVDRVWLSQRPDLAAFKDQIYDFSCGELRSRFDFRVNGVTSSVEVVTFCSRTQPTLTLQQISVTVDKPCNLVLRGFMNPEGQPGRGFRLRAVRACDRGRAVPPTSSLAGTGRRGRMDRQSCEGNGARLRDPARRGGG